MADPTAAIEISEAALRRLMPWRAGLLGVALAAVWLATTLPVLVTDALPLSLRGLEAEAVVERPPSHRSAGRASLTDLPLAWTTAEGDRVQALLTAIGRREAEVGSRVSILYLPDDPQRATVHPLLFRLFAALPLVAGLGFAGFLWRDWRGHRTSLRRLRATLAEGRRERVKVTGAKRQTDGTALRWRAADGRQGKWHADATPRVRPGTEILLWVSADGREVWADGWVEDLIRRAGP